MINIEPITQKVLLKIFILSSKLLCWETTVSVNYVVTRIK